MQSLILSLPMIPAREIERSELGNDEQVSAGISAVRGT